MRGYRLAMVAALLLAGCGDPDGGRDAAIGDAASSDGAVGMIPVDPPAEAALPSMGTCPDGWLESEEDAPHCEPWVAGDGPGCAADEARFPGEAGCVTVGSPCPAGPFAEDLPSDRPVVYSLAGASGGDGTRALPFGTLGRGINEAGSDGVVALGRGRYDEIIWLRDGDSVQGACARETVLTASGTPLGTEALVTALGSGIELRDLSLVDGQRVGVYAMGAGVDIHLEGVVIAGAVNLGVFAVEAARVTGHEILVRDTRPAPDLTFGRGIGVQLAEIELRRAVVAGSLEAGVLVGGEGATGLLEDIVIRDTAGQRSDGLGGRGLSVQGSAVVSVSRAVVERNRDFGIRVAGEGSALSLERAVIRDTRSTALDRDRGSGVFVETGARATIATSVVEGSRTSAVVATLAGTDATITDTLLRDTLPREADGTNGWGAAISNGASCELSRVVLDRNRELGVFVSDAAALVATDLTVRDTDASDADGEGGRAVTAQRAAVVQLSRALFERNTEVALNGSDEGTIVGAADLIVRDTRGRAVDGFAGRAVNSQLGAVVEVERALLERDRSVEAIASVGATLRLRHVVARDTLERDCSTSTCVEAPSGMGVAAIDRGAVDVQRFEILSAPLCGVLVAANGELDLSQGLVAGASVGACIQVDGFDLSRLTDRVLYRDNGINLDTTELPVPGALNPLGG